MTMHDRSASRTSDEMHDLLTQARPDQILRLLRDVMRSNPDQRGAAAHEQ